MTRIVIEKSGPVIGTVHVPGSKSATNRALIVAALASGESTLPEASMSDDSELLSRALRQTGAEIELLSGDGGIRVVGNGGRVWLATSEFFAGNAGTALRFLTSYLCLGDRPCVLDGDERMRERPIQGLVDALRTLGADVTCVRGNGCPPVEIRGSGIRGGTVSIDGSVSSQFVSSVLLAAPYFREDLRLNVAGVMASKTYVDLTCEVMRDFGVGVQREGYRSFQVKAGRPYRARTYQVPPDMAGANYFFALAAVTGGRITVAGVQRRPGDIEIKFLDVLAAMGCAVSESGDGVEVAGAAMRGVDVDMSDAPDSVQTLACVALFAEGPTRIRNVANLRVKETDRIHALGNELTKLGARVEAHPDGLTVTPGPLRMAEIETYRDHRMAMSFAVAGAAIGNVTVRDPECVRKSFPDFFDRVRQVGVSLAYRG